MIIYERTYSIPWVLNVYMIFENAAEYAKMDAKLHEHSEYDTKWTILTNEWMEKGYFEWYNVEQMTGRSNVILCLKLANIKYDKDFITELNAYLDDYPSDSIATIKMSTKIEDFIK